MKDLLFFVGIIGILAILGLVAVYYALDIWDVVKDIGWSRRRARSVSDEAKPEAL